MDRPSEPPRAGIARPLQLRQGDVLLVQVDAIPATARREPRRGRIVLAEGEATGHAHAIASADAIAYLDEGQRYLLTRSRARLVHEEHGPIEVPAGAWRVIRQREHVPATSLAGAWRTVAD